MFTPVTGTQVSFAGHKLVLPCISVGNVPQLTVDLYVNTLKLPRVGYLEDDSLLPVVGNDAFDHTRPSGHLHTSAEVYSSPEIQTTVVQIRAPIAKGCVRSFCKKLISWSRDEKFSEVVVLTSTYAHERKDSQIRGEPYRFLLTPEASGLNSHFTETLNWTPLEPRKSSLDVAESLSKSSKITASEIFLPGSGQAKKLYIESCSSGVRMIVLIAFCSQGDNIQDALSLATYIDQWLELKPQKKEKASSYANKDGRYWSCPSSWSLMYGGPSPDNIF